jgi:hypothetical protein
MEAETVTKPEPATGKPKAKKPASKRCKPEMDRDKFAAKAVELYKRKLNISQIAQALGYPKGHGQNRVANALIKAGFYRGHRKVTA